MTHGGMLPLNSMSVDVRRGCNSKGSGGDGAEGLFSIKAFIDQLVPRDDMNNPAVDKGGSLLETQGVKKLSGSEVAGLLGRKGSFSFGDAGGRVKPLSVSAWNSNGYPWVKYLSTDMTAAGHRACNAAEEGIQIHPEDKTGNQTVDNIETAEKSFPGGDRGYLGKTSRNLSASGYFSGKPEDSEGGKKKGLSGADNKQVEKLKIALPTVAALRGKAVELGNKEPALDRISVKEKIEFPNTGLRNEVLSRQLFQDVNGKRYFDYHLEKNADVDLKNTSNMLKANINAINMTTDRLDKNVDIGRKNPGNALKSNISTINTPTDRLDKNADTGRKNPGNVLKPGNYAINITHGHPENKSARKLYERKILEGKSNHKSSRVRIGDNKKYRLSGVSGKRGESSGLSRIKPSPFKDTLPESRFGNEVTQKEISIKSSVDVSAISRTESAARSDFSVENPAELNSKILSDVEGKLMEQIEIVKSGRAAGKETEIKIKLSPPELGELKLTVLIKEGKRIRASFVTNTASAGNIINGGAERLSEAILRHGFVLENLDVSVDNPDDNAEKGVWENPSEGSGNSEFNPESNEKRLPVAKPAGDGINLLV